VGNGITSLIRTGGGEKAWLAPGVPL
jgi:hypothetical protein